MPSDSLIFRPVAGGGIFSDIADRMRADAEPATPSKIVPVGSSYVEWCDVPATHLGLDAMTSEGYFVPLVFVPLAAFTDQRDREFRSQPLFRLAWYGHL
jgi:hypothetical protein